MSDSWEPISRSSRRAEDADPDPRPRRWHVEVLLASGMTVLLALGLDAGSDGRVTARGLPGIGLPQVCAARAGLGFRCPACGLTRSLIRLSRGDLAGSLLAHRLGWLLGGAIALQVPYRWAALRRRRALLSTRQEWLAAAALVALVLVNWLVEIAAEGGFTAWPRLFYGP